MCLFEPQASLHMTPLGLSTASCPQRSEGTQTVGSPFFCLLFFGDAKKSESLSGDPDIYACHYPSLGPELTLHWAESIND